MTQETDPIARLIDHPKISLVNSLPVATRKKWNGPKEAVFCAGLMANYEKWRWLVDAPEATEINLEKIISPSGIKKKQFPLQSLGLPRADAIIWHGPDRISILEAKITSSPVDVCQGIGQLIYYKTMAERCWGVEIEALILTCPFLPPLILETIANVRAPIRFLKAEEHLYSGLVPKYD